MDNDRIELMENTPVRKAIIKLAVPTMLSMAVALIYNMTDTFFIGRLNDPNLVAALSVVTPVFMAVQAIGNIFANGSSSYISRKLGAKDNREAERTSSTAVYSAVLTGLLITALLIIFRKPLLSVIGTSPATFGAADSYFTVISAFAAVFIIQITLAGLTRSEGATDKAMVGMFLGIGLNIVLDPLMIIMLDMGVAGAAWATVIGNIAGTLYFIRYLVSKKTSLSVAPRDFHPTAKIYGEIFKIGIPSALSNIVMSFSMVLVNILAAGYGDHVVAGNGIQMRIASMAFMLLIGLAQGYQPFAGYNYGAMKYDRLKDGFKTTFIFSTALGLFFTVIFRIFGDGLIALFIFDQPTIEAGSTMLKAFSTAIPFIGFQMTMMITFQATGKAVRSMILALGRQCLLYIPALFILNSLFGFNGFIWAQPIADVLTTGVAVLMSLSFFRELNRHDAGRSFSPVFQPVPVPAAE